MPERFGVKIHAYVLMPNHYHLELELGEPPALSAAMHWHWLNTGYGIWFNRRYRRIGALFQGRYKAILFDPNDCLLAIHDYIHLNPVRGRSAQGQKGPGQHRAGMTLQQIGTELGASSYSAVAMQVGRLQRQLPHQTALRNKLQAIAKRLNVQCNKQPPLPPPAIAPVL